MVALLEDPGPTDRGQVIDKRANLAAVLLTGRRVRSASSSRGRTCAGWAVGERLLPVGEEWVWATDVQAASPGW